MTRFTRSIILATAPLLVLACSAQVPAAPEGGAPSADDRAPDESVDRAGNEQGKGEQDDATARRAFQKQWSGEWSADYRKFMNEAAKYERARYGHMLPGAYDSYAAAAGTNWVNLGPTHADKEVNGGTTLTQTDAGRVNAIVVDPTATSTIYACFSGGGVWKTTDAGNTWAAKTETVGSLSCGALAMDPANSQVLYLGLGDAFDGTGIGILKSVDGGNTWTGPVYAGAATRTNAIVVAQDNSNIVLAATNAGLFRSTDAGATFNAVSLATGFADVPLAWSIAYTGGATYALSLEAQPTLTTGTTNGQVFTSADDGATWVKSTGPTASTGVGRISLASAPTNRLQVYAMAAVPNSAAATDLADLFRSTNGGKSFTAMGATARKAAYSNRNTESTGPSTILNGQGWYNHALIVDPANAATFYFGGALLLARATNATATATYTQMTNWLAQFSLPYAHADFHAATFDSAGNFYVGTDGGIFKSTDKGATWSSALNNGIASHLIYSVGSSLNNRAAIVGGFQDNGTRVRSGTTSTFNQAIGGDGFGANVNAANAASMLGSLYYTRVYKSTNGGGTFASASSGITESNNSSTAPFETHIIPWTGDTTGNTIFTAVNLKLYKTTNYATSWTAVAATGLPTTSFNIRAHNVAPSNVNVLGVVANGGRVYLTNNNGASWTLAAALPGNASYNSYVSFDPIDPNTVYVASVAPDQTKNHLWKSTNFGASWSTIDGAGFPTGVPVDFVAADPGSASTLYAGTHLGPYRSTDGGATWSRFGAGMPLVEVKDIYVSPDSSLVRAATFGRGFWELQ